MKNHRQRGEASKSEKPTPLQRLSLPAEKVGNLKQRINREDGCKELKDDTPEKENTVKNMGNLGARRHNRPETKTPEEEDRNNFGENKGKTEEEEEEEEAAATKEEKKEARQKPTKRETPHVRT